MYHKTAQLILNSGKKSDFTCDIFISQPDAVKEQLAGKLFVIAEIKSSRATGLKILNFIIDNLNHNYYQNEKILLREKIPSLKIDHIFEATLAKVNKNLSNFLNSEKINAEGMLLNITAGIIHENKLFFSNTGNNRMFLIYRKKEGAEAENDKYSVTEIKDESGRDTAKGKVFTSVLSGRIPKNGYFLFTNEALPEYVSQNQLSSIVSSLPPVSAAEQMKNILDEINVHIPFLAFIIKNSIQEKKEPQIVKIIPGSNDSIIDLNRTEDQTESLLAPSGLISFKKWISLPSLGMGKEAGHNPDKLYLKDKIFFKKKASNRLKRVFWTAKNLTVNLLGLSAAAVMKAARSLPLANGKPETGGFKDKYLPIILSKRNKILFLVSFVFIGLFAFNTLKTKNVNDLEERERKYAQIAADIKQKQNHIEANLLYSNDESARKLFQEIEGLIASLPEEKEDPENEYGEIRQTYNQQLEKLRKVVKIDPETVADLGGTDNQANPENIIFLPEKKRIYAADPGGKSVYLIDLAEKETKTIMDLNLDTETLSDPVYDQAGVIHYASEKGIISFDPASEVFKKPVENGMDGIVDMEIYGGRLYALMPGKNQILRYNFANGLPSSPNSWAADGIELQNAVSISIDGNIYALNLDGTAQRMLRGQSTEFRLETVEPALTSPNKIVASADLDYIYVLETSSNRIVVYDKEGDFRFQYQSEKFEDLKDFQIDEAEKTIYFLDSNTVYKSQMEDLPA